jgi:hypothetical protein
VVLPIDDVTASARFDLIRPPDDRQAWGDLSTAPIRIELPATRSAPAAAPSAS